MNAIQHLINHLQAHQLDVESVISAVPSSPRRELITEANMHLMIVIQKLKYAQTAQEKY